MNATRSRLSICRIVCALALVLTYRVYAQGEAGSQNDDVVWATTFDTPAERAMWATAEFATWVTGHLATTSLSIAVPREQTAGAHMVRVPLDLKPYRGCRLQFECQVKADGVSPPPESYLGVKFMLHYQSVAEGPFWQNPGPLSGTFDWSSLRFSARIAPDATDGEIDLGLQDSSGVVWFDDLRVTVQQAARMRPPPPPNAPPVFRGHDLPRLRGVMSPGSFRDEDLRVLGREWKANVIRWQFTRNWGLAGTDRDLAEYDQWLAGRMEEFDRVLAASLRYGLKVILDLHTPPGGRYPNHGLAIFNEAIYQDHWVATWETLARRYRGHPAIWGYDLINEPGPWEPVAAGGTDYLAAQERVARAIRAIDPEVPIFIEAADGDSARGFRDLEPIDLPNLIYEVHLYEPHTFTHQGVSGAWVPVAYPGEIGGQRWDQEQLRRVLQPVRDFQLAYNVHIYVGEFSAIRWAPGAAQYLRDSIELFEEYGWDWTYHAYREWEGWNVDYGSDPQDHRPTRDATDRKQLLLGWFEKNVSPARRNP